LDGRAILFGPYRLLAAQRLLLEGDKPVRLGSRAFDILTVLVERAGEVVGKEELIARAWPATFVEEANLKIQVSALRRALGDGQGDQSLHRHRCRTGLQFRRADTQRGAVAGRAVPDLRADGAAQSAVRDNSDDWPRGSRDNACRTTLAAGAW
jgi:DNA-binding winged helix-turn-helix (wHTH) protein